MYKKPTQKNVKNAMLCGWPEEDSKRGYAIFNYDGTGMLQIEAIGDCYPTQKEEDGYDDEACAMQAQKSGYCKIIPVDELPENFEYEGHSLKWFGWVDTPENRQAIINYSN